MTMRKAGPVAGAFPPDSRLVRPVDQAELNAAAAIDAPYERRKIHRLLLVESMRRLRSGRQLERAHGVIHPEMTAIIRDVLRLTEFVFPGPAGETVRAEVVEAATSRAAPSSGSAALQAMVDRSSWARVSRVSGIDEPRLRRLATGEDGATDDEAAQIEGRLRIPAESWGGEDR